MATRCFWRLLPACVLVLPLSLSAAAAAADQQVDAARPIRFKNALPSGRLTEEELEAKGTQLLAELKASKFKIIHETFRDGDWELVVRNADGSEPVNVTQTPAVHELFPHASPDGKKVVFVVDAGEGETRTRDVYYMKMDGAGRVKAGDNGREPFWRPDGKVIGFSKGTRVITNREGGDHQGLYFYNIETGQYSQHPNADIARLVNPCWSPDGKWIISSAMGGMGFNHSIVAMEADGKRVVELRRSIFEQPKAVQCRPDVSPDGKRIAWGIETGEERAEWVEVSDLDWSGAAPRIDQRRYVVGVPFPLQTYHVDWSPDGKYIAYAEGGRGTKMAPASFVVGTKAPGWDIWVVKPSEPGSGGPIDV